MLADAGPSPVPVFHAVDVEQGKSPFDGWTIDERRALVDEALNLLLDPRLCANLYAVGCTIVVDDFGTLLTGGSKPTVAKLYELCYYTVFREVFQCSPFMGSDFVFDEKDKVKGAIEKRFEDTRAWFDADPQLKGKLNHCVFQDDRKCVPLQAADLLAYELRRRAWDRAQDEHAPTRPAYARIMNTFRDSSTTPPYRLRRFRRYDRRFRDAVQRAWDAGTLTPDAWFTLPAPED